MVLESRKFGKITHEKLFQQTTVKQTMSFIFNFPLQLHKEHLKKCFAVTSRGPQKWVDLDLTCYKSQYWLKEVIQPIDIRNVIINK